MEKERFKARDVPPTALRLHPDTRAELARLAFINGRSLSKEIAVRLEASLKTGEMAPAPAIPASYTAPNLVTAEHTNEKGPASALTDADRAMLEVFRKLPPKRQLALLSLFE